MNRVIDGVEIADTYIKCLDGTIIDLANIREVVVGFEISLLPSRVSVLPSRK